MPYRHAPQPSLGRGAYPAPRETLRGAKRPVRLANALRALRWRAKTKRCAARLGAGKAPCLPYRHAPRPSPGRGAYPVPREILQGAKRPVCLANALRALRWRAKTKRCAARLGAGKAPCLSRRHAPRPSLGRGAYPAPRETCMEPDKAVLLARNRALSACLGADTAARQTCRDGHVYCKRPNRLPVFTCKPCVLPLAILAECPSAAGNVGEFFASPRTDKRKGRALFVAAKSGGGARLLGFHAHGASFLPPAQAPNPGKPFRFLLVFVHATACAKRPPPPALILVPQAILLPPGFCACGGVRARYLPPARTGPPIPASRFTSSWSLCVRRCAPMRAVSRTCGAKFSGVAQKGAPSS